MQDIVKQMANSGWRCLRTDPPPPETRMFFVGSASGGRIDWVFRWPGPDWKIAFWCRGETENYRLTDYTPDVWYPGPPTIPGSEVEAIQKGKS